MSTRPVGASVGLSRSRVLRAAVDVADRDGLDGVSMRRLAAHLGVAPMALYRHVANRDAVLDGMVELILEAIDRPVTPDGWKNDVRAQVLAARRSLLEHPWAAAAIESRTAPPASALMHIDALATALLAGGLSADLVHHALHALGSRMWGFTHDVFPAPPPGPDSAAAIPEGLAEHYPGLAEVAAAAAHNSDTVVGPGCDDQLEFEFALDLWLDGVERLHASGWSSDSAC
ncbi:TetR/AcrR family transcriptional regulator [Rhodococcus sp. I2R]|uniref:TetR/AcrR family transcriptional regulator n=1 Tax=Rhodococcus sp. I2R TaxID=2855445 RepID=UPI001E3308BD|nr:TetR/AcrR family transcriptional regulator C-terminal domain-containing protein [Rhodococcus sp. I2R]MCC8928833.1 TetR/AcrR family transcriptional regulator C-terminal domain-containing protein [Rhodococcus sp. I2R]